MKEVVGNKSKIVMHSFPPDVAATKTTKYCAPLAFIPQPKSWAKIMAILSDPSHIQKWFLYKAPDAITWCTY